MYGRKYIFGNCAEHNKRRTTCVMFGVRDTDGSVILVDFHFFLYVKSNITVR
jgi:hypothetical protein